jgi:DNA-binding SARP family transcriptional activator
VDLAQQPATGSLLPKGKPLALLVYCTTERSRSLSRESLASIIWSEVPADRARHSLRQAIWRLRRVVGDTLITADDDVVVIGPDIRTDRDEFLDAVHGGDVERALALYTGRFLEGLALPGGEAFEEWALIERTRLEEALVRVVQRALAIESPTSSAAACRSLVQQMLERAPEHLDAHRIGIETMLSLGDRVGARRYADALGALAAQRDVPLSEQAMAAMARANALDATEPDAAATLLLDFVGRDAEFGELMAAWQRAVRGESSVAVLTGVAGIGKSRLLATIRQRCSARGTRAVLVRANPGEQTIAFGFAAFLTRAVCALPGAAGISGESAAELVALDPALASVFRVAPRPFDATESPRRRALALADLLAAVAEQQPLAVLIDDWHWMDASSQQLLTVALARGEQLPLWAVVASRPHDDPGSRLPSTTTITLRPLPSDDLISAILGTGEWPDLPEVERFTDALVAASSGIPLDIIERLSLLISTGALTQHGGRWSAPDWAIATRDVAAASPLARQLAACPEPQRDLLRLMAVAGAPLPDAVVRGIPGWATLLPVLEDTGLIRRSSGAWELLHDALAELVLAGSHTESVRQAHDMLAQAWVADGGAAPEPSVHHERLHVALRHAALADNIPLAAECGRQLVQRARLLGDRRHARSLLAELLASSIPTTTVDRLLHALPWHQRMARPGYRVTAAVFTVVMLLIIAGAWRALRRPTLEVAQMAMVFSSRPPDASNEFRLLPSLIISLPRSSSAGPTTVHAEIQSPTAEIFAGGDAPVVNGLASFSSLGIRTRDSIVTLRLTASNYRSVDVTVHNQLYAVGSPYIVSAHLIEATLNAQHILPAAPRIVVAPGEPISGVVKVGYTSGYSAASVWLASTPTWGDPRTEGQDELPIATPVRDNAYDVAVQHRAPSIAGRYWLLFAVKAEPAGGFILSGTNWQTEKAVWGDGNDLALLSDERIVQANREGLLSLPVALPPSSRTRESECTTPVNARLTYCTQPVGLFGIEIVVAAPRTTLP